MEPWDCSPSPVKAQVRKGEHRGLDASMTLQLSARRKGINQNVSPFCSWKEELTGTGCTAHFHFSGTNSWFWSCFPLKAPGVLGEMRIPAFGVRKESTAESSADPQERLSLNREA